MNFVKMYDKNLGETVLRGTHQSGMPVTIIQKTGFSKSYATFSTKYGSINTVFQAPGENAPTEVIDGVAHFLEHKVFEQPDGTNAFNEFSKYGANANAFTSFGITNYLFSCTENFYENLKILLSFVQKPYFTEENVEKEKGIIAQEIRMYDDDADQTCFYNCLEAMYQKHPVKTKIAGSVEEIMKTTPNLLYRCYNTFYHPSNMAVVCVGDIDAQRVGEIVEECISPEKSKGSIVQVFPKEPEAVAKKRAEAYFDIPRPMFMLGFKDIHTGGNGKELLMRDILTNAVLATLFGSSSPFYKELYEKGIINKSFSAFYEYEESCAYAAFTGETNEVDKLIEKIYETIEYALETGIDERVFLRMKKVMLGRFLSVLDNIESFGNEYVFALHRGIDLLEYPSVLKDATVDAANTRLRELFNKERSSVSVVLPKKSV